MGSAVQVAIGPRKTPVQARSAVTVDAIHEATIQVLLTYGPDRLTTTRVAARAGVSVGTLYQYFPNKQSLLYAVLDRHLTRVVEAVEAACARGHGQPIPAMVQELVQSFVDAKLERADVSVALYTIAADMDAARQRLLKEIAGRGRAALAAMLVTAPGAWFAEVEAVAFLLYSSMTGSTRTVLEAGAPPEMVAMLRRELAAMAESYLRERGTEGPGSV